jgi:hypothetical protein
MGSNVSMGILNIQNIQICLQTNDTVKEYGNKEEMEDRRSNLNEKPIDLQTRLKVGQTKRAINDYNGYQILKPLAYLNGPTKKFGDFKLWNI